VFIWVDVRDVALAHVNAMERDAAENKRFFVTEGFFSNRQIVDVIRKHFPEYKNEMPDESVKGGDFPEVNKILHAYCSTNPLC
jgi:nucleoside-diphosphate-sugar epimerase